MLRIVADRCYFLLSFRANPTTAITTAINPKSPAGTSLEGARLLCRGLAHEKPPLPEADGGTVAVVEGGFGVIVTAGGVTVFVTVIGGVVGVGVRVAVGAVVGAVTFAV